MVEKKKTCTVWYLEMTDKKQHVQKRLDPAKPQIEIKKVNDFRVNREMYKQVGGPWRWTDRLVWSDDEWRAYAGDSAIETLLVSVEGTEIGYAELRYDLPDEIEIVYFGLLPQAMNKGYGGALLSLLIDRCWEHNPGRVWLHTCSNDAPHALANYKKRGFVLFDTKTEEY